MTNTTTHDEAETKIAEMSAVLTDEALCLAWAATETEPVTADAALVRGWLMDELHRRLGDDQFDTWLTDYDADGNGADPLAYLATKDK